jgi:hypothetical protein
LCRLHLDLAQRQHHLLCARLLTSPHVRLSWSRLILSISLVQSQPVRSYFAGPFDESFITPEICPNGAAPRGDDTDCLGITGSSDVTHMDDASIAMAGDRGVGSHLRQIARSKCRSGVPH